MLIIFGWVKRTKNNSAKVGCSAIHSALAQRVESEQLAGKTPLQLKFIRESMQAQREYQAAINKQHGEQS
jgi:hypothetical protein